MSEYQIYAVKKGDKWLSRFLLKATPNPVQWTDCFECAMLYRSDDKRKADADAEILEGEVVNITAQTQLATLQKVREILWHIPQTDNGFIDLKEAGEYLDQLTEQIKEGSVE